MSAPKRTGENHKRRHQRSATENTALLHEVENSWKQVVDSHWSAHALEQLLQIVHRIVNTSARFGSQQISTTAKMMETTLRDILENPIGATSEMQERLENQFNLLMSAIFAIQKPKPGRREEEADSQNIRVVRARQEIYLLKGSLQPDEIAEQISYFGYAVQVFTDLSDLLQAVRQKAPKAILIDMIFPETLAADPDWVARLQKELSYLPPLIFISESGSLKSRLQAVRAGSEAYFTKPVDIVLLVEVLDQLTAEETQEPYRVLIVDDSPVQADITARHLQAYGMQTCTIHDPFHIMEPLDDFHPNIILLDTYMPGCTGPELTKVIRQIEKYVITPIIYLSSDDDREKQLDTLISDSEDIIPKSIGAERLKSIVRSRIDRFRQLRSMMVRDSLTGLYNHTAIKERLDQELSRASRQNSTLCLAMIDLDHFKQVNDTYGHSAGDRVLKGIGHFLTQRLRKTDIVGRYGGEEFVVILPDTPLSSAIHVFDELRMGFLRVHHRGGNTDFTVKLSIGLACYPDYSSPTALLEAADKALYQAKNQGRNQIVAVEP
jgi:diguanylate cyclase (GGDEF)-like protein